MIERTAAVVFWEIVKENDYRGRLTLVEEFNQLRLDEELDNWDEAQMEIIIALGIASPSDPPEDVRRAMAKAKIDVPQLPQYREYRAAFEKRREQLRQARESRNANWQKSNEQLAAEAQAKIEWESKPHLSVNAVAEIIHLTIPNYTVRAIAGWITPHRPKPGNL